MVYLPTGILWSILLLSAWVTASPSPRDSSEVAVDHSVLILGGGVAGVIAARTLHQQGINDFLILDARSELGGRMQVQKFGSPSVGSQFYVERGPNWIQGTQTGNGPKNPILTLSEKVNLTNHISDYSSLKYYDYDGAADYSDLNDNADAEFEALVVAAGNRINTRRVDGNARTAYNLVGKKKKDARAQAAEYFVFDWEFGQSPEEGSWIASALNNNYTFDSKSGGYSEDNLLSVDQRGFKVIIQSEAKTFLKPAQVSLNSTVTNIKYTTSGVTVTLKSGKKLTAKHAICTFSIGVLQNDDVTFTPALPDWKLEALQTISMTTYTKIFMQFPTKFWFDTEFALYADKQRGKYPVWQSLDVEGFLPGSKTLFATVTGDYAEYVDSLTDQEVKAECLQVLRAMYPNITIPEPSAFFRPRWYSDPLFRGSYSNWPAGFRSETQLNVRATVSDRLWFAGEGTSYRYFGFLHGAYDEGLNVATAVAKCIKGQGCVQIKHDTAVVNPGPYTVNK